MGADYQKIVSFLFFTGHDEFLYTLGHEWTRCTSSPIGTFLYFVAKQKIFYEEKLVVFFG